MPSAFGEIRQSRSYSADYMICQPVIWFISVSILGMMVTCFKSCAYPYNPYHTGLSITFTDRELEKGVLWFQRKLNLHSHIHSLTTLSLTQSLTHSLTHSLFHSLTHWLTHSFTHSLFHSLAHSLAHPLTNSLTHSLTHSFNHLLTHSLIN